MIVQIQKIPNKIPYPYTINNCIDYEVNGYMLPLGNRFENIIDLHRYKLTDVVNGEVIERLVLTDHILDLTNPKTLTGGIYPILSNLRQSVKHNTEIIYDEGKVNSSYPLYINMLGTHICKGFRPVLSLQHFHINSLQSIMHQITSDWMNVSDEVKQFCKNQANCIGQEHARYEPILQNISVNSANAALTALWLLTDESTYCENGIEELVEHRADSLMPYIEHYNTFEQLEVIQKGPYNHYVNQILCQSASPQLLDQGISLVNYIKYNANMIHENQILNYRNMFDVNDGVEFDFPRELSIAFNCIISYLYCSSKFPIVLNVSMDGFSIVDDSMCCFKQPFDPTVDVKDFLEVLWYEGVTKITITISNEEDIFIVYTYKGIEHRVYIDMFNWAFVSYSNMPQQSVF